MAEQKQQTQQQQQQQQQQPPQQQQQPHQQPTQQPQQQQQQQPQNVNTAQPQQQQQSQPQQQQVQQQQQHPPITQAHQQPQQQQQQMQQQATGGISSVANMNTIAANPLAAASIRNPIPQVQVIPQMHSPPYLTPAQFNYNQVMLQNAAMQAAMQSMNMNMNPQQLNMGMNMAAMMQGRPPSVTGNLNSPSILSPSPTTPTQQTPILNFSSVNTQVTATVTQASNAKMGNDGKTSEGMAPPQQAQATALVGGKPIMSTQGLTGAPPLVLGVLPSQVTNAQGFVNQTKGQTVAVTFAHANQPQVMTSQSIRFSQPQIVSSTGQMSSPSMLTNQAVLQAMAGLQQQGIPLAHQPLFSAPGQSQAILAGQSLYIRAANPMQAQQGMMTATGVQTLGTLKGARIDTPQNLQVKASVGPMQLTKPEFNQVGKALLPAKTMTAKVTPNISGQRPKLSIPNLTKNVTRGRPKNQSKVASTPTATASTNTVASALAAQAKANSAAVSKSKPANPTVQAVNLTTQVKGKSEAEVDSTKQNGVDDASKNKITENTITDVHQPEKPTEPVKPTVAVEAKIEAMDTSEKQENKEKETPVVIEKQRAIVKPHILTHVIEGFVIQEGPEPFPVQQSSLLTEFIPPKPGDKKLNNSPLDGSSSSGSPSEYSMVVREPVKSPAVFEKCEFCGSTEQTAKFRRSKRFCSIACAKRYNVACSRRISMFKPKGRAGRPPNSLKKKRAMMNLKKGWRPGKGERLSYNTSTKLPGEMEMEENQFDLEEQSSSQSENESSSTPDSPTTPHAHGEVEMETDNPQSNPAKWNVIEVYEFIKSMPGCAPYADEFRSQEIDGQALMLLKEDHLMTAMNMKLGPALKICAKINSLKDEFV